MSTTMTNYLQDATKFHVIEWKDKKRGYLDETAFELTLDKDKEERLTEKEEIKPRIISAGELEEDITPVGSFRQHSEEYIVYNTQELISSLINEFSLWRKVQTEDALVHISKIKDSVNKFESYLHQKPESRILISTLQLILENNRWESITRTQITQLVSELERFQDGNVDWKNLEKFSQQMYRTKLNIVKQF